MINVVWIILFLLTATGYAATDPTMPPHWRAQATAPVDIVVSGIFENADQNTAIINGENVRVSDFVKGYEVIKINADSVSLKNNRGIFVIPLKMDIKTPVVDKKTASQESH